MEFPDPLIPARLVRRYKRFLADIELDGGKAVTARCPNPGAMTGLAAPGAEVFVLPARNPNRKLKYTWELARVGVHLVGINTAHPNPLVAEAIAAGQIAELAGYDGLRREVKYGTNSRIDILLEAAGKPDCYVEIKNVHLKRDAAADTGRAEFPDSVTARGAKHLREMANMVEAGARAVMVYVVQRGDYDRFTLADDIDPAYAAAFADARQRGVEAVCYACDVALERIEISRPLPIDT
jgi:sugar fermentation stimulation protein A